MLTFLDSKVLGMLKWCKGRKDSGSSFLFV